MPFRAHAFYALCSALYCTVHAAPIPMIAACNVLIIFSVNTSLNVLSFLFCSIVFCIIGAIVKCIDAAMIAYTSDDDTEVSISAVFMIDLAIYAFVYTYPMSCERGN